jgi:hypothetical protein
MAEKTGGFQTFEFHLGKFKLFWVKRAGFGKNWRLFAHVDVVLYSMGRSGHHITRV